MHHKSQRAVVSWFSFMTRAPSCLTQWSMLKREKHDAVSITQIQNACELPLSLYPGYDPPFLLLHRLTPSSLSLVWTTPMWPAWDDWLEWFLSKRSAILSDESCFIYMLYVPPLLFLHLFSWLSFLSFFFFRADRISSCVRPSKAQWQWLEWKCALRWPVSVTVGTPQMYPR